MILLVGLVLVGGLMVLIVAGAATAARRPGEDGTRRALAIALSGTVLLLSPGLLLVLANGWTDGLLCAGDAVCEAPDAYPALVIGVGAVVATVTTMVVGVRRRWRTEVMAVMGVAGTLVLLLALFAGLAYDELVPRP